jgi:hypothetical protein
MKPHSFHRMAGYMQQTQKSQGSGHGMQKQKRPGHIELRSSPPRRPTACRVSWASFACGALETRISVSKRDRPATDIETYPFSSDRAALVDSPPHWMSRLGSDELEVVVIEA